MDSSANACGSTHHSQARQLRLVVPQWAEQGEYGVIEDVEPLDGSAGGVQRRGETAETQHKWVVPWAVKWMAKYLRYALSRRVAQTCWCPQRSIVVSINPRGGTQGTHQVVDVVVEHIVCDGQLGGQERVSCASAPSGNACERTRSMTACTAT